MELEIDITGKRSHKDEITDEARQRVMRLDW